MMKLSKLMSPLQKLPNRKKRQNRQSNTKQPIKADSSCDIFEMENKSDNIYFSTVPFVITVDGRDYVDNEEIDVHELVTAMASSSKSHTSCPSPHDWMTEFAHPIFQEATTAPAQPDR